jgi:7-carboxy-7-deazaguanine synthase
VRVLEVFASLQGEGVNLGKPAVFIRLAGCPLRCVYCDTKYAWDFGGGVEMSVDEVVAKAVAGGEGTRGGDRRGAAHMAGPRP